MILQIIKKINFLYILAFSFIIFLISIMVLNSTKDSLVSSQKNLQTTTNLAVKYSNIKKQWNSKKYTLKTIDNILKSLKLNDIDKNITSKKIIVTVDKISTVKIDKLLNKLLNKKLNIQKLKITDNSIYFEVGIK